MDTKLDTMKQSRCCKLRCIWKFLFVIKSDGGLSRTLKTSVSETYLCCIQHGVCTTRLVL
jgi:hypothetical protein